MTRAQDRLFPRTAPVIDLDGNKVWELHEVLPDHSLECSKLWRVIKTPSGRLESILRVFGPHGSSFTRCLRRIEENHLLKFCINRD